jgi:hypothetical protein
MHLKKEPNSRFSGNRHNDGSRGPSGDILQWTVTAANIGCTALLHAVSRAKPLFYCFGHIHEAYRAREITRTDEETEIGANAIDDQPSTTQVYPRSSKRSLSFGNELWWLTLLLWVCWLSQQIQRVWSSWIYLQGREILVRRTLR